jgi:hypothetical protein
MCRVALVTYKNPDRAHMGLEPLVTSAFIRNLLPLVQKNGTRIVPTGHRRK